MSAKIRPLTQKDLGPLQDFTDQAIGKGYYSGSDLLDVFRRSQKGDEMCSFLLIGSADEILGFRFTYPPGNWDHGKGKGLSPHLWRTALVDTAYFQSLFLAADRQAEGWGRQLSLASLEVLKRLGAQAVVCHSWVESPNNSSAKYLSRLGFEPITRYPQYWKDVDYECTRCGKPCLCTAEEMILYLK